MAVSHKCSGKGNRNIYSTSRHEAIQEKEKGTETATTKAQRPEEQNSAPVWDLGVATIELALNPGHTGNGSLT